MTYTLINYVTDIHHLYKWCSLAISRSGATSIAELFHYNVSAILIPYPHAADNHQELNAKAFCNHSNGYYINQNNVTFDKLIELAKKTQKKQTNKQLNID
jgi:UDP-N-acetylglucosamine--N-acetylmuramyl-(pentapeptide) pyrophosphoryl-undecaprenol N-acetylglucosamine transferase